MKVQSSGGFLFFLPLATSFLSLACPNPQIGMPKYRLRVNVKGPNVFIRTSYSEIRSRNLPAVFLIFTPLSAARLLRLLSESRGNWYASRCFVLFCLDFLFLFSSLLLPSSINRVATSSPTKLRFCFSPGNNEPILST